MARSSSNPFLDVDGYICIPEIVALTREIEKEATKLGLKPAEVYFSGKVIPKYDEARADKLADAFTKKRAQPIKSRARMPASGSRVKMQVILRNFKNLDELGDDFTKDFGLALKAIDAHTRQAVKVQEKFKAAGAKAREKNAKEFDKNIESFIGDVLPENFEEGEDYVVGTSMMGKTLLVKLPNGGYVSIGKADADRFNKALNAGDEPAKPAIGRGRAAKPAAEEKKPSRSSRHEKHSSGRSSSKPASTSKPGRSSRR